MSNEEVCTVDNGDHNEVFEPPSPKRLHKRTVKVGTTITVPHNVMISERLNAVAVRNKVSPTALVGIVAAIIDESGGDKNAVVLGHSQSHSFRLEATKSIAQAIKEIWEPPKKGIIHWDGKLMVILEGFGKEERLPILILGEFV